MSTTLTVYPDGPDQPGVSIPCRDGFVARVVSAVAENNIPDAQHAALILNGFDNLLEVSLIRQDRIKGLAGALEEILNLKLDLEPNQRAGVDHYVELHCAITHIAADALGADSPAPGLMAREIKELGDLNIELLDALKNARDALMGVFPGNFDLIDGAITKAEGR